MPQTLGTFLRSRDESFLEENGRGMEVGVLGSISFSFELTSCVVPVDDGLGKSPHGASECGCSPVGRGDEWLFGRHLRRNW